MVGFGIYLGAELGDDLLGGNTTGAHYISYCYYSPFLEKVEHIVIVVVE